MPSSPLPSSSASTAPLCTLAGTPGSGPQALWLRLQARWRAHAPDRPFPLACWTANATDDPLPPGDWCWLPTPAQAPAAERHLELHCRQRLMEQIEAQGSSLRVLYGLPQHQETALWELLLALTEGAASTANPAAVATDPAAGNGHLHAPGLRCRECLDPDSERRLFSRLLGTPPAG